MKHNFYEELKDQMTYAEMPNHVANLFLNEMVNLASENGLPQSNVDVFKKAVEKYCSYVLTNSSNKSVCLRTFAEVLDYATSKSYFRNALRMINDNYIA